MAALVKHWSGAAALVVMKSFASRGIVSADADVVQIFTAISGWNSSQSELDSTL
jgi:hypothetical protein